MRLLQPSPSSSSWLRHPGNPKKCGVRNWKAMPHAAFRIPRLKLINAAPDDTVLKEFKIRLGRIGIEYQTPVRP